MPRHITLEYPFTVIEAPEEYRGAPYIDPKKCIGCASCANACPANAITKSLDLKEGSKKIILDIGRCIRCGRCEEACPTGAIKLTRIFELASRIRDNHIEVVELSLHKCPRCGKYTEFTRRQIFLAIRIFPEEVLRTEALDKRIWLCRDCKRESAVLEIIDKEWKWYYGKLLGKI